MRKCNLDLAPDAPWRCPAECPSFAPRLADVNWKHGTLVVPPTPPEPPGLDDGSAAALLDEAEDVINAVFAKTVAEVDGKKSGRNSSDRGWLRRFGFGKKR